MNEEVIATLKRLKEKYTFEISSEKDLIHLDVDGLNEKFRLSISPVDHIVFTKIWHEHFDEPPMNLQSLLENLLSGNIQIVVKYRGDTPVSHRTRIIRNDGPKYSSWTRSLVSPFWRRKSYKTFTYEAANLRLHKDRSCPRGL